MVAQPCALLDAWKCSESGECAALGSVGWTDHRQMAHGLVQVDIHAPWGGVVPKLAQEAHERAMDSTVRGRAARRLASPRSSWKALRSQLGLACLSAYRCRPSLAKG